MSEKLVAGMPEIMGSILSNAVKGNTDSLKADTIGFIKHRTGLDLAGNTISVVENNDSTVHISLPFYTGVDSPAEPISEENLQETSGGYVPPHAYWNADFYRKSLVNAIASPDNYESFGFVHHGDSGDFQSYLDTHDAAMSGENAEGYLRSNFK